MKKIALLAALAIAMPVWAQEQKPAAAQEPAKPEAAAPAAPVAPVAQEAPKPKPVKKANPRRQEDARHCLEKASNDEIIKCAEAYL
jgi:hypothetical protein